MNYDTMFAAIAEMWDQREEFIEKAKEILNELIKMSDPSLSAGLMEYPNEMTLADVVRANLRPVQRFCIKEGQTHKQPIIRRARSSC